MDRNFFVPMNFHYAACTYLNEYIETDEPCITALKTNPNDEIVCQELAAMAHAYGISRNFTDSQKAGAARFQPVLTALRETQLPTSENATECVSFFTEKLELITGKTLLSAASKILWMRFQTPIIIYDSLTWKYFVCKKLLKDSTSSYEDFCSVWRDEFSVVRPEIERASFDLVSFRQFTLAASMEADALRQITSCRWFHERVFDHAIVNLPGL